MTLSQRSNYVGVLPIEARAAIAAAIVFGRHRPSCFISRDDLETTEMPEYQILAEFDPEKDGYWVTVEPVPKRERSVIIHYGDPGDEHQE